MIRGCINNTIRSLHLITSQQSNRRIPVVTRKIKGREKVNELTSCRISQRIASSGLGSRREAERWILDGKVTLNGIVLEHPAVCVTLKDIVMLDQKVIPAPSAPKIWLAHKKKGELVSNIDPKGRPTIFDRFKNMALPSHLMPIGRLDFNTEGLLLLTNDGELAREWELPSNGIRREYTAVVRGTPSEWKFEALARGIRVEKIKYRPMKAEVIRERGKDVWIRVVLHEGKNREVRKALAHVKFVVKKLTRTAFGPYKLDRIAPGEVKSVRVLPAKHVVKVKPTSPGIVAKTKETTMKE